jgi:predicted metalloprotease with PDZ domain
MHPMVARIPVLLLVTFVMHSPLSAAAQTAPVPGFDPIRYTVSFPEPQTHYVEVSAVVPTDGRAELELMMAVWTPGSYLVREYARHVEAVTASDADGRALQIAKSDKNRWRVVTDAAPWVDVRYRVYAREMSVRTNWVEADFAMLNGAPTFMTLVDGLARPHEVVIQPAAGWQASVTGLAEIPGGSHRYVAPDFDTLVDSPIVIGNPSIYEFTVDDKPHFLVNVGEDGVFDGARAARDVETVVREHHRMWGMLPYEKYVFLNMLTLVGNGGGGLEHKNSAMLMSSRWATGTRRSYLSWLGLASHEYFHTWNIKRLRPVELGPFDYEDEVHTRSLWMAEGLTDYYGELALHRSGLSTREELFESLSSRVEGLQTTPGRLVQSVEEASFDAWIKYYRPNENSVNTAVSYYTKGAVLGFLLDGRIRAATAGVSSLDDVMRAAFERFSGDRGFTPDEFRAVVEQVSGLDLAAFWEGAVGGTAELEYDDTLETFGLRFRSVAGPSNDRPQAAWLGMSTRNIDGRVVVTQVRRGTPAFEAGLNVDDEILAMNGFRVRADQLAARLGQYRLGDAVALLVARRDALRTIEAVFGAEPPTQWRLEVDPAAADTQQRQRDQWLQPGL